MPALCTIAAALALHAAALDPDLAAAERAWAAGEIDNVLPRVTDALKHELPADQRRRAFELAALTHAAFDREAEAVDAYRHLLGVDPEYRPADSASPKVKGYFATAFAKGPVGAPAWVPKVEGPSPAPDAADVEPPVFKRWWFWAGVGVVAAGAGAATYAVTRPNIPSGTLGTAALQR